MAMKVRYTVVDGEILSELRDGVKRDYVPDPSGSIVALLDNTQAVTDTFSYWPYGESAGRTGTTATPFQYVGSFGYYQDGTSRNYVRARYLDKGKGRWITRDSFGNTLRKYQAYTYVSNNPGTLIDFLGLHPAYPYIGGIQVVGKLLELCKNIAICQQHNQDFLWFYAMVRQGGPWDYKNLLQPWQAWEVFGNFNYGVAGTACGFSRLRLLNEAGSAQCRRHKQEPDVISVGRPGSMIGLNDGIWPFGDDPRDANAIQRGIDYYNQLKSTGFKLCYDIDPGWPILYGDNPPFTWHGFIKAH